MDIPPPWFSPGRRFRPRSLQSRQHRYPPRERLRPQRGQRPGAGLGLLLLLALAGCANTGTPPPIPVVTISAGAVSVTEGGPLDFSIAARPAPRTDLTVVVTVAYGGCDVAQSSKSVTIAAGDSSTTLTVHTSGAAGCTVTATIAGGQGYRPGRAADASAGAAVTAVADSPDPRPAPAEPVVTVAAEQSRVTEGDDLSFTVTAAPPPKSALKVTVSWSDPGSFLTEPVQQTVTIPTSGTAPLRAATENDSADEPDDVVTVTISDGSGYKVGSPDSATVTVTDNDASTTGGTPPAPRTNWRCTFNTYCPLVSVAADHPRVAEGTPALFTLTADPLPRSALTVSLDWVYDPARVGERPQTVTFDAGSSTASVRVDTVDDHDTDGDDYLLVAITRESASASNPYGLNLVANAMVVVEDND